MENYIVGVYGEEFRQVLEWALGCDQEVTADMRSAAYGEDADDDDKIPELDRKVQQVFQVLMALTEDESQDIVIGAGSGNGLEAWRKLGRRWDPVVAGRKRALLKQIISPERCRLDQLVGCWERWEEQVRKYERRKDERGQRLRLDQETKMSAFELMLPIDLENHLILNKKRLNTYEAQKEEIEGILESRLGARIRELQIKPRDKRGNDPNAMDVDAFQNAKGKGKKGDKGKGKGKGVKGSSNPTVTAECWNCGRKGHLARDCWRTSGSANSGGNPKGDKGKGKTKGKKGKGRGLHSVEGKGPGGEGGDAWSPVEVTALDIGALCGVVAGDSEAASGCSCVRSSMLGNGKTCGVVAGDSVTAPGVPCSQKWIFELSGFGIFR